MFLYINISEDIKIGLLSFEDAGVFLELMEKNRQYLEEFMPRIAETRSIDDTKNVIKNFLYQLMNGDGFKGGICFKETLIGIIGFKYIDWKNKKSEIMYWIDKNYSSRGIVTSCVKKIVEIAFLEYGLNKVIIKSSVDNEGSKKVAEKCGFILEGILRQEELLYSGYSNICIYGLLKQDYH